MPQMFVEGAICIGTNLNDEPTPRPNHKGFKSKQIGAGREYDHLRMCRGRGFVGALEGQLQRLLLCTVLKGP